MTAISTSAVGYFKAACDHCGGPIRGLTNGGELSMTGHINPTDYRIDGVHTAFPADDTVEDLTYAEFAALEVKS